jgi:F-type H+-transporting ATPase subunit b
MNRRGRVLSTAVVALLLLLSAALAQHQPVANPPQGTKSEPAAKPQEPAREKTAQQESPGQELTEASEHAAGEGEENAEFKQSASVRFLARITGLSLHSAYWLAIALNFAVIAAAVAWFVKSKLPGMFRTRSESIRKTMEEAQRASADAGRRLSEIEGRLSKLDNEIAAMRSQAEAEAAGEEQRIKAAAEEDARKIVESAGQEVEAAARLAHRDLKAYAAELAVSLAEKRIQVDATTDRALVERFVGELGQNGGGKEGK